MKKETFEAQKAFAGKKKPSMLRRCVGHDYTKRQIYLITMVTEGRRQDLRPKILKIVKCIGIRKVWAKFANL